MKHETEDPVIVLLSDRLKRLAAHPLTRATRECANDLAGLCDDRSFPDSVVRDAHLMVQVLEQPASAGNAATARRLASQIATSLAEVA